MKVVFCTPTLSRPHPAYVEAMTASVPALEAAGIDHGLVFKVGSPYISAARSELLRKAMDADAEMVVFIDHDVSWRPQDLLALIRTEADVAAGLYRFKTPDEEYMGQWETDATGFPLVRPDGCLRGARAPAGFLKVSRAAVERFMRAYPELSYGSPISPCTDLFNHGAFEGVWWGEDYAFSRRWRACGGEIAIPPDLDLTHHADTADYPGNLHRWLMRQPGGACDPARAATA